MGVLLRPPIPMTVIDASEASVGVSSGVAANLGVDTHAPRGVRLPLAVAELEQHACGVAVGVAGAGAAEGATADAVEGATADAAAGAAARHRTLSSAASRSRIED